MFRRFGVRVLVILIIACSLAMALVAKAQDGAHTVAYDTPISGELTAAANTQSFTFTGSGGDVVDIYLSAVGSDANTTLIPSVTVKDSSSKTIVDSNNKHIGGKTVGNNNGTSFYNNYVFAVPADGNYTITLKPSQSNQQGKFILTVRKAVVLEFDKPVIDTQAVSKFEGLRFGGLYTIKSSTDFSLAFKQTSGKFNITAAISLVDDSSDSQTVGFIGGASPDSFASQVNPAFIGGSISVHGHIRPYIITVGNAISGYDSGIPQDAPDPLAYELVVHSLDAQAAIPSSNAPTLAPSSTAAVAPPLVFDKVEGHWTTLTFDGCLGFNLGGGSVTVHAPSDYSYTWSDGSGQTHKSGKGGQLAAGTYPGINLGFGNKPVKNPITVSLTIGDVEVAHVSADSPCPDVAKP